MINLISAHHSTNQFHNELFINRLNLRVLIYLFGHEIDDDIYQKNT